MKLSLYNALKTALFTVASITFVVGVGFGTHHIINNKNNENEIIPSIVGNQEFKEIKKSGKAPVHLIEHETNGIYFLDQEGLEELNSRIVNELNFGPEIDVLKSIRINNLSVLSANVSGQYNPFTQEMEISISAYGEIFKNIPIEEKIDLIFQTIVHEYGHHFSNTYITSIAKNDRRNSQKLFSQYGDKSVYKNINKEFLNAFEKSLNYSNTKVNNTLNNNPASLGYFITARDLYLKSNNTKIDLGIIDNYGTRNILPFEKKQFLYPNDSKWYSYLFSIDELLTRKLQQISYIDLLNGKTIANKSTQFTGTINKGELQPSTFASDIIKNRKITWNGNENEKTYTIGDELKLLDDPFGGKFTNKMGETLTINPSVQELWKAYFDVAGYEYGISQIFMKNNSIQKGRDKRSAILNNNFNQIKISGWLNSDASNNYKSIILTKSNGTKFLLDLELEKKDYKYKWLEAKTNLLSKNTSISKVQNKFGYVTNYFPIWEIDTSKALKVWNDKNNNNKIDNGEEESLTTPPTRPVTTFRESFVKTYEDNSTYRDRDIIGQKFYEIVSIENEAYLQSYSIVDEKVKSESLLLNFWNKNIFDPNTIHIPNGIIMTNNNQKKSEK